MSRRLVLFVLVAIVAATVSTIAHEQMRVVGVIVKFEKSLLDVKTKEALGTNLLRQATKAPVPTHTFWSLTRIGGRSLFYGP